MANARTKAKSKKRTAIKDLKPRDSRNVKGGDKTTTTTTTSRPQISEITLTKSTDIATTDL